jgi:hypothetical protein
VFFFLVLSRILRGSDEFFANFRENSGVVGFYTVSGNSARSAGVPAHTSSIVSVPAFRDGHHPRC